MNMIIRMWYRLFPPEKEWGLLATSHRIDLHPMPRHNARLRNCMRGIGDDHTKTEVMRTKPHQVHNGYME